MTAVSMGAGYLSGALHDPVSFWAWTALHVVTPVLLPVLYPRNRAYDPGPPAAGEGRVPAWARRVLPVPGGAQLPSPWPCT